VLGRTRCRGRWTVGKVTGLGTTATPTESFWGVKELVWGRTSPSQPGTGNVGQSIVFGKNSKCTLDLTGNGEKRDPGKADRD